MVWLVYFFFSSRRRHTRLTCDWSSDVCSSDLSKPGGAWGVPPVKGLTPVEGVGIHGDPLRRDGALHIGGGSEEGRGGEEGWYWGAPDHLKKKKKSKG